jgi:hypothetical protein
LGAVGDINISHRQGIKDFGGSSPADSIRQVVVANQEEDRDATGGETIDSFGKFPLVSLGWLTAPVGIATEEDKVYPVLHGIIYHLVKSV